MSSIELSVILPTSEPYTALRHTLRQLGAQTALGRFELVLVTSAYAHLAPDEADLARLGPYRIVEAGEGASAGQLMAAGARAAQAPLVAFAEDHTYPDPGWAEALIDAFAGPWAAVGAMLANANPGVVSMADMLLNFGPWIEPGEAGEVTGLAPHNTAYRREVLLRYGAALGGLLESEVVLHQALVTQGQRLYFEPRARVRHVNAGRWALFMPQQLYGGQMFGASRARFGGWTWQRRWLYIAAAPLILPLRLARLIQSRRGRGFGSASWRIMPTLVLGIGLHTLGEALGYTTGMGASVRGKAQVYRGRIQDIAKQGTK